MNYTWDDQKRLKVLDDHRVDFRNLEDIFADPSGVEFVDDEHSTEEEIRYAIIGITAAYGLVYLVYTEPSDDEIHYITARRAENWMVTVYDQRRSRI
jgi:uncharacterized DUF497 family protein